MIVELLHRAIRLRFHRLGFRSRILPLENCRIHYYQRTACGTGTPIVFLHGLGTSSSTWIKILPLLPRAQSITCVDLPGHGFSRITSGEPFFPMNRLDAVLEQWFDRTQTAPVLLVGHSLGGWLAARFALRHPRSVRRLVLINAAGIHYPGAEKQAEAFTLKRTADARRLLDLLWYRYPWYFKPFTGGVFHSMQKRSIASFVASVRPDDFINHSLPELTPALDVIWGEEDRLTDVQSADIIRGLLPNAGVHRVPKCGHVPQLERPRLLAPLLRDIIHTSASDESAGGREAPDCTGGGTSK